MRLGGGPMLPCMPPPYVACCPMAGGHHAHRRRLSHLHTHLLQLLGSVDLPRHHRCAANHGNAHAGSGSAAGSRGHPAAAATVWLLPGLAPAAVPLPLSLLVAMLLLLLLRCVLPLPGRPSILALRALALRRRLPAALLPARGLASPVASLVPRPLRCHFAKEGHLGMSAGWQGSGAV